MFKNPHQSVCLLILEERKGTTEQERGISMWHRNINSLPLICAPTVDQTCNQFFCLTGIWIQNVFLYGMTVRSLRPLLQGHQSHFYICKRNDFIFMKWPEIYKNILILLSVHIFYLFICLFIYFRMKGKGGRKRRTETSMCGCLLHTPNWRPGQHFRHEP